MNDAILSKNNFLKGKKDDIFGFIAFDEDKNIIGFITVFEFDLMPPLNSTQWWIPYIFVNSEFCCQGIGSALLGEIIKSAKEINVVQLTAISQSDEAFNFGFENNFGLYGQMKYQTEKTHAVGLRIV